MKPIDFHGIISLDQTLVSDLRLFLQEKETELSRCIIYAIPVSFGKSPPLIALEDIEGTLRLPEAVEIFAQYIHKLASSKNNQIAAEAWESAVKQINSALWEYVEVLEGRVKELFQQLEQIGFEQWHEELVKTLNAIKEMLNGRIEELVWKIRRLEALLWEYRAICEGHSKKMVSLQFLLFWKTLLDKSLQSQLKICRKYLNDKYHLFSKRAHQFFKVKAKIDNSVKKFNGYYVFRSLDEQSQGDFKKVYWLLKLWECNRSSKYISEKEPVKALKNAYSTERVTALFKEYLKALSGALFERSRKFKNDSNQLYLESSNRRIIAEVIKGYRAEVHTLGATMAKYRQFFLRTHPNPYIRSTWGFSKWMVGQEPAQTKELINATYEVEFIDKLFESLNAALEKGPALYDDAHLEKHYQEIENTLHEMGQPLISHSVMRMRVKKLLDQLSQIEELGSFNLKAVDDTSRALSRAIRLDWQYHALFEQSLFHQIFSTHQGILGESADRSHLNRKFKFSKLISQIENWVQTRTTYRHLHEIEMDMSDMKGYLQDFLACTQRVFGEDDITEAELKAHVEMISRQLLEYRYLFGQFFFYLGQYGVEGKQIRAQFLFVDQYFESVETLVHEIESLWKTE